MPVDRPPRAAPGREPRLMLVSNMWPQPADASFGIFVAQQVDDLRALGLEIAVCFVDGRASRANYARGIVRLRQQLGRHRPDLVHAHHVLAGLVALAAGARRPGRPLLVTHHGIEVFEGWQAPLARWLTRRVDRSLVVSPAMARQLGLGPEAVLPCGVDLVAFAPGDRRAARTALGLPIDGLRVAWLGADRPEKRLALAVAAIERLRERRPEARLHRIGGLPPEAVPLQLQACDALLLCSTHEGSPQAVKEALAVGLPVVATAVGDLPELLAGLPGCAVIDGAEPDLAGALAAALARALASGRVDARARLAGYARPTIAAGLRAIYRDCLGWAPERGPEPAGTGEGPA